MELCGIGAPADPVYGLPIVVCPGCGRAAVRTRDGLGRRWRRAVGVAAAAAGAVVQLAVLGFMTTMLSVTVWGIGAQLRQLGAGWWALPGACFDGRSAKVAEWMRVQGAAALGVMALGGLACGLWLASAMHHWRRGTLLAAFGVVLAAGLASPVLADAVDRWLDARGGGVPWSRWTDAMGGWAVALGFVAAGMGAARSAWALALRFRAARFGRMRGRIRKLRHA